MWRYDRREWLAATGRALAVGVLGTAAPRLLMAYQQRRRRGKQRPMALKVKEGDPAPSFELTAVVIEHGKPVRKKLKLTDFKGKKNIVLYFFPKASTPG